MLDFMRLVTFQAVGISAAVGPWIVTRDEIADPHALNITLEISGEILQHSNTRELVFGVPALIEYVSSVVILEPSDIVATGTPAGVGFAQTSPLSYVPATRWSFASGVSESSEIQSSANHIPLIEYDINTELPSLYLT